MIPFLDHILVEMQDRFGTTQQQYVKLLSLIPSIVDEDASIDEVGALYKDDLPCHHMLSREFSRWITKWKAVQAGDRPDSLQEALYQCD